MKNLKFFFIFYSFIWVFYSCDKIEGPYIENNIITDTIACPIPQFTVKTNFQKNVLLEEFTGFRCGYCPQGHRLLDSLSIIYGSKLISYSIHSGYYSEPKINTNYKIDFRTQSGLDIFDYFQIKDTPKAMIDRNSIKGSYAVNTNGWKENLDMELAKAPVLDIQIKADIDTVNHKLCSHIRVQCLQTFSQNLNLTVYLVEDNIKYWQTDYSADPQDIENYNHRDVLRASINGTWGEQLNQATVVKDQFFIKSYKFYYNNNWNYKNLKIIAFVTDKATKEVLQAEKFSLEK
ncbi:MAG: Omp28 family outer membrane lipoprotein [Bacteroidales bacterium]|nr:Omp28 family outer membrane lipoprotein [Bacteroidales bacterium]